MTTEAERPVILLIESDEALASVILHFLRHDGYQVVRADLPAAVADALVAALAGLCASSDLVLLDLDGWEPQNVQLDGCELAGKRLVLLVSDRFIWQWLRRLEGVSVLYKPFTMQAFRDRIRAVVSLKEAGE